MKKALYGTTALVAASLVAGHASAASGLKLGISGFYRGAIGASFGSSDPFGITNDVFVGGSGTEGGGDWGRNTVAFRQEVRVNFSGSTTLDNGITVGVLVGLNAGGNYSTSTNAPARINRAYMDISGKFGQVRFGDANSAYLSMCVGDPGNVTANFGLNSPNESFSNVGRTAQRANYASTANSGAVKSVNGGREFPTDIAGGGTCFGLQTRGTEIIYFSPTFGGFNFAVSYTPSEGGFMGGGLRASGGSGGRNGTNLNSALANLVSAGINFNHDFGGITLSAGVSGDWALSGKTAPTDNAANTTNKPSMYQAGVQVGFGGAWAVGASGQWVNNYLGAGYGSADGNATATDDAYMITAGGSYTMDAISIGLEGLYDRFQTNGDNTHITVWGVSLNAAYALGPGISLEGQVAYTKSNNDIGGPEYSALDGEHSVEIDVGTAINF